METRLSLPAMQNLFATCWFSLNRRICILQCKCTFSIKTTNKYYCGTCENTFKKPYNNHKYYFRNKSREKNNKLSKYVWELKEKNINYFINWDIPMKAQKYVCGSQKCDLCICEKILFARVYPNVLLKRVELVFKCSYKNRFTLKCFRNR